MRCLIEDVEIKPDCFIYPAIIIIVVFGNFNVTKLQKKLAQRDYYTLIVI